MQIVLSARARKDLLAIQKHYQTSDYAQGWFADHFEAAVEHLQRMPDIALRRGDLTSRDDVRFWLMEPYWLILRRDRDILLIIAVIHSSRDVMRQLKRRKG